MGKKDNNSSGNPPYIRSQTRAMWITGWATVLCVGISLISLYVAFKANVAASKESCFLSVKAVTGNYPTTLDGFGSSGTGNGPTENYYLNTLWNCTIVNTGDKAMTVLAYKISTDPNEGDNREFDFTDKFHQGSLPRTLAPGDSFVMQIEGSLNIDIRAYRTINKAFPVAKKIAISKAIQEVYKNQIDIFGNPIECKYNGRRISVIGYRQYNLKKNPPISVAIKTAKGSHFRATGHWYSPDNPIPFSSPLEWYSN